MIRIVNKLNLKLGDEQDDVVREVEFLIMFLSYMFSQLNCAVVSDDYKQQVNDELLNVPQGTRIFPVSHTFPVPITDWPNLPHLPPADVKRYRRHIVQYAYPYVNLTKKGLYEDWPQFQAWFQENKESLLAKDNWSWLQSETLATDVFITDYYVNDTYQLPTRIYQLQFATELESD